MNDRDLMLRIDELLSHVWMVRTFLKHCEEAEEDDELNEVHRDLYDAMHALGGPFESDDPSAYLKQVKKKLSKMRQATELFLEIQPEISSHTNFQMAARSLRTAINDVDRLLNPTT